MGKIKTEIFETKKPCNHSYKQCKRVNDIQIGEQFFRQVVCEICGKYKYEINIKQYHIFLRNEIITIKK